MKNKLVVTKSVTVKAKKSQVWDALTNPEMIKKYFFGTETESDFKKGSPIYYRGVWEGKSYEDKGTIFEIEKEKLFKHDYWSSMSGTEDKPENYATITYTLSGNDGNVTLAVTQTNVASEEQKEHSEKNWEMVFQGMKELIEK
ncbi:MAG TPA: SRPBCC family protein [Cyclobacteriaceae bacterium]